MAVRYASKTDVDQVRTALRRVARELDEGEPYHLVDYLDRFARLGPGAPYSAWLAAFRKAEKKAAQADEGTADAQIKLCTRLALSFADEAGWEALLNCLGRVEIEGTVRSLARRLASAEVPLSRYEADLDTLSDIIGVPDAEAVVRDIYREHGLSVAAPKPETKPDPAPGAAFDASRPEAQADPPGTPAYAPPEPQEPEKETSLLGGIGNFLLRAAADYADSELDRRRKLREETPDVGGVWYAPDGLTYQISQSGFNVSLSGFAAGAPVQARGQIGGKELQMQGFSPAIGAFRAALSVSDDARTIQGQIVSGAGQTAPVVLRR